MSDAPDFAALRSRFPGLGGKTYLDVSARGLLPQETRDAVMAQVDAQMTGTCDKAAMLAMIERCRSRFAQLINARPDEIAFTKNVSEGINSIMAAFPWQKGDKIVYCPELEHPANLYPWLHISKRAGVELVAIAPEDGRIPAEKVVAAIDDRTRMVTLASVTFAPGFRTDLAPISAACKARGVFLLADAVQGCGILHTDVEAQGIDGLAVSTQKGLLALYGMGFLYCRKSWAERMVPAYLSRFGVDLGDAHEAEAGDDNYRLNPGAKRFDVGNFNYAGAAAVDASLGLLLEQGGKAVEARATGLARRLVEGFLAEGFPVCGGAPGPHLGSIVTVGRIGKGGHDTADDPMVNGLYRHLVENQVCLTIRRGVLRFSIHVYNDESDIDRVIELAHQWRGRNSIAAE
ncbi:MAG: aminotransferase class V-fold PLP-dependent enzyme [Alphaproteobacteria bacterium]